MKQNQFIQKLISIADAAKGESICWVDFRDGNFPVLSALLVTAMNHIHLRTIAEGMAQKTKELARQYPNDIAEPVISGDTKSGWVVVDFGSLAVHIMTEELRSYYKMDSFFEKHGIVFHHE